MLNNQAFSRWVELCLLNGIHNIAHPYPERIRSGFYRWRKRTGKGKQVEVRVEPGMLILIKRKNRSRRR